MAAKGQLTQRKIIDKSLQLFSRKGYYHTSIKDIMKATNLTKGGLYGHFSSKEEIWYAVHQEAVRVWREIVFAGLEGIEDPLDRLERLLENNLKNYLGANVMEGGCFFVNMLVELSGQADVMGKHVLKGFIQFAGVIKKFLEEAQEKGLLKEGLNFQEIANYMVITLNGAATLYAAIHDPLIWKQTQSQLSTYIRLLRA